MEIAQQKVILAPDRKGCKKEADRTSWKREREKLERHKAKRPPVIPTCKHGRSHGYKCTELTTQDYSKFHRHFYANTSKVDQDTFLLKYCSSQTPKQAGKKKTQTIRYFIPMHSINRKGKRTLTLKKVCQKAITTVLGISKDRIQRICKNHLTTMTLPKERRGGDRRTNQYAERKESVMSFIKELKSVESHYVRGKSTVQYLSSDLSIKKLHKTYNESHSVHVKYEYFRRIFNKYFNLSFKTPATDACSKCIELKEKIKVESDQRKKQLLMGQYRIHRLRAKWFYTALRCENVDEISFSFDCQKNLVLPKVPDQSAYFSRQLYAYNLTICQGTSRARQDDKNTFIYTWLETEAAKGSNQIASAVYHRLTNTIFENTKKHVRLFCDGCGGQNKNKIVLGMLAHWLKTKAPNHITKLTVTFPVVGHSFLPPDRIFGNIEREIRQKEVIVQPEEYHCIFEKHGTVLRLGKDFTFHDWKSAVQKVLKPPGSWHFQFNASKRLFLRKDKTGKIAIKGEPNYVSEIVNYGNICKRGKTFQNIQPAIIDIGVPVKPAKLQDVKRLLAKHFGEDWPTYQALEFYAHSIRQIEIDGTVEEEEETDNEESAMADDVEVRV